MKDANRFIIHAQHEGYGLWLVCRDCNWCSRYLDLPIAADWIEAIIEMHPEEDCDSARRD